MPCIAFEKLDGSNLRFQWTHKHGWNRFGVRYRLFDQSDPVFGIAIDLFLTKYAKDIERIIKGDKQFRNANEVICYCEFFGPASFAGQHDPIILGVPNNDPKDLVLFDVNVHKKGLLGPRDFINTFGDLHIPTVVYDGILNASFIEDVQQGKYPVKEGVVCKGGRGHKLWMRKIKTLAYLIELKNRFKEDFQN